MFYKRFCEISKTKLLRCDIKNRDGTIFIYVIDNRDEKFWNLITESFIDITDENLYGYEHWSNDIKQNNEKLTVYVEEQKTKIDFLHKISGEHKDFCQKYILCKDPVVFLSNHFDNDLNKFIQFKNNLIYRFCDKLYEQLKDINSVEIKNVLICIEQIKLHNFSNFKTFQETHDYWPELLRPNPFLL